MTRNLTDSAGVLSDGNDTQCSGDCALFKGIAVRGLVAFAAACNYAPALSLAQISTASLWQNAREATSTSFSVDWSGPPPNLDYSLYIGNAISALAALGSMAGANSSSSSPSAPSLLGRPILTALQRKRLGDATSIYIEAENGLLFSLGYEAVYGNFSGWGYVAGWESVDQSVQYWLGTDSMWCFK